LNDLAALINSASFGALGGLQPSMPMTTLPPTLDHSRLADVGRDAAGAVGRDVLYSQRGG
jgi:hypothetical protein